MSQGGGGNGSALRKDFHRDSGPLPPAPPAVKHHGASSSLLRPQRRMRGTEPFFFSSSTIGAGVPPPPPLQTKVTIAGKTKCTIGKIFWGHFFLVHYLLGPETPPPLF